MSILLIPNEITTNSAIIWAGFIKEEFDLQAISLRLSDGTIIDLNQQWIEYETKSKKNKLFYQYIHLKNLLPKTDFTAHLQSGSDILTTCNFRTLPESLPAANEKPFTILLASCFCSGQIGSDTLGAAYLQIRKREKIDLKILCGDQVYLDFPADHFFKHTHDYEELEDLLLANYVKTWTQGRLKNPAAGIPVSGYQYFLQNGANFFSSDDHEFWNNAPSRATLIRDSWSRQGRLNWWDIAENLLKIFQSRNSRTIFNVGTLSFYIADTRVGRDNNRTRFLSADDFDALENWVANLSDVGVLVVGQPIFSKKAGLIMGNIGDWNMPDFAQYENFARVLMKSEHSIIVLTGDVHFGRVASCQIKPGVFIYEIISSPTALVDPRVGGKWHEAPDSFPAFNVSGIARKPIETNFDYQLTENHFLLIDFSREGNKTKVVVRACDISGDKTSPIPLGGTNPIPFKVTEVKLS